MNTSNPRFWVIGGVLAALLVGVLGWAFIVSPRFAAAGKTRDEAVALEDQALVVMAQANRLKDQARDLPEQIRALRRIQKRIPASVDVPALLREVQRSARANDVELQSMTPGQITAFTSVQPEAGTTSPDGQATPSAAPTPAPTSADMGQGRLPEGMGLSYVPLNITAVGQFGNLERFVAEVENLQRAYLVTGAQLTRSTADGAGVTNPLSLSLDTRVFVSNDRLRQLPDKALETLREAQ